MGLAIVSMHYIGIDAMRMAAVTRYRPVLLALSIVIAGVVSAAAMSLAFRTRGGTPDLVKRLLAALLMGTAICGMHYCGMAAVRFYHTDVPPARSTTAFSSAISAGPPLASLRCSASGSCCSPRSSLRKNAAP